MEVDSVFEAEAAEGELLGTELDEAGLGGEDGEEVRDAAGVVGTGGFIGLGGEGGGGVDGGGAFGEEAFGGEGVFDFAEGFEDGLLELGEGFVLFGVADFGFGAELATGEEGLDDVAGELPDAEVAVEEFGEVAGGGAGAGGEGEAGEEGAAGFGEAFAAGGEAAFGSEDVGAALEEFGGESGGDFAGDGREFGGGELAGGVAAEEDFELAGAAFEGLLAFDAGGAGGGGVGFGEAELGSGAAVFLLAAEEAFADGVGGFLEDGFGFCGEGDLLFGFGEGEPSGGDLGGDGGLGGANVLGGGFSFGGGGGHTGADAAPEIEFPVDGGGEVELVEGVGEDGARVTGAAWAADGEADEVLLLAVASEGEVGGGEACGAGDAGLLAGLVKAGGGDAEVAVVEEGFVNEGAEAGVFEAGDPVGVDAGAGFFDGLPGGRDFQFGLVHSAGRRERGTTGEEGAD